MTYNNSVILLDQARAYLSLARSIFPVNRSGAMCYLHQAKKCIALINKDKRMVTIKELNDLKTFLKVD